MPPFLRNLLDNQTRAINKARVIPGEGMNATQLEDGVLVEKIDDFEEVETEELATINFVTITFDEDDQEFTVNWSVPYYNIQDYVNNQTQFIVERFSSGGTAFDSPRFVFDKPASDQTLTLYFDVVDRYKGNSESVKWKNASIVTSDPDTSVREIAGTPYVGMFQFASITLKADGTSTIQMFGQTFEQLNNIPLRPYLFYENFGTDQVYKYDRDNEKISLQMKVYNQGGISFPSLTSAAIPASTVNKQFFVEWDSNGAATIVETLSGGILASAVICVLSTGADNEITEFSGPSVDIIFPPASFSSATINDGDVLNTIGGIIISIT